MSTESTPLGLPAHNPTGELPVPGGAIGGQVQPAKPASPRQLVFECKLKDCDAILELRTHGSRDKDGVHRWTQLSASVCIKAPKGRIPAYRPQQVRVAFALADLVECHLARWSLDHNTLWIDSASFDVEPKDLQRVIEFLTSLGVEIEDHTKGSAS